MILQIFTKLKFERQTLITLDFALKKEDNYYPQEFLKECKQIQQKLSSHINDHLSDFSSDEPDEG